MLTYYKSAPDYIKATSVDRGTLPKIIHNHQGTPKKQRTMYKCYLTLFIVQPAVIDCGL